MVLDEAELSKYIKPRAMAAAPSQADPSLVAPQLPEPAPHGSAEAAAHKQHQAAPRLTRPGAEVLWPALDWICPFDALPILAWAGHKL